MVNQAAASLSNERQFREVMGPGPWAAPTLV